MTLADLIERLEAATGPDRELDARIAAALEPHRFDAPGFPAERPISPFTYSKSEGVIRFAGGGMLDINYFPAVTGSIDAAVSFCNRVLPGWAWRVATCCVSDDAWVFPDFNCPVHGERLKAEFNQDLDWTDATDVDLRPSGRPAVALIMSVLKAKQIIGGEA